MLGLFLLIHGLYHVGEFFGNDFFSDDILEPFSILLLLTLAVYVKKFIFAPRDRNPSKKPTNLPDPVISSKGPIPVLVLPIFTLVMTTFFNIIFQSPAEVFTLIGIVISASLFAWMAISNPTYPSIHFEFAIIVLIWAAAEIPHSLSSLGLLSLNGIQLWGTWGHFISMFFIFVFVCLRTIKIALFQPRIYRTISTKQM